ncbi:MAG: hypothetical protein WC483_06335 [Candidatus Paceibacterota bacterium]
MSPSSGASAPSSDGSGAPAGSSFIEREAGGGKQGMRLPFLLSGRLEAGSRGCAFLSQLQLSAFRLTLPASRDSVYDTTALPKGGDHVLFQTGAAIRFARSAGHPCGEPSDRLARGFVSVVEFRRIRPRQAASAAVARLGVHGPCRPATIAGRRRRRGLVRSHGPAVPARRLRARQPAD